jgi:hypothetical protein
MWAWMRDQRERMGALLARAAVWLCGLPAIEQALSGRGFHLISEAKLERWQDRVAENLVYKAASAKGVPLCVEGAPSTHDVQQLEVPAFIAVRDPGPAAKVLWEHLRSLRDKEN